MHERWAHTCVYKSLAAVDMHTAQHLVQHALSGPLVAGRTVILVTHHISMCLPVASFLVELSDGKVVYQGTIQELQSRGLLRKVIEAEDISESSMVKASHEEVNEADLTLQNGAEKHKRPVSNGKLIDAEARAEGRVSLHSYLTYIRAAGYVSWILSTWLLIQLRLINIAVQVRGVLAGMVNIFLTPETSSIWPNGVKHMRTARPPTLHSCRATGSGSVYHLRIKMSFPGF